MQQYISQKHKKKSIDRKPNIHFDFNKENDKEGPKIKEYENIKIFFAKSHILNWSDEGFVITKVKNSVPWIYVINDLKEEKTVVTFQKKELWKTDRKRIEDIIKRKDDKLYVS